MSGLTDTWMTPQEQYGGLLCFYSVVCLRLKNWSLFTLIVLDLAATLFTPETPKLFQTLHQPLHRLHLIGEYF